MRASELGPAWPGFVKRSRQTHPRVGGKFGILRPFNVSSEAFNWTACLGAVEIFKLSAGGWRQRARRTRCLNAPMRLLGAIFSTVIYFRPLNGIHGKWQSVGNASPFRVG
jgi:hypothetical protein